MLMDSGDAKMASECFCQNLSGRGFVCRFIFNKTGDESRSRLGEELLGTSHFHSKETHIPEL